MKKNTTELIFIVFVILLSIAGFWELFLGVDADPDAYHYLHAFTSMAWLLLLLSQLILIEKKRFSKHRKLGLAIFFMGPVIISTVALLSVHSASKAAAAGQGDFMIVQNVMVTLELGIIILMAFVLRKKRKLHGAFLMSSALLFMGIALFFVLINFIPQYKIEGPETFYRFETAGITASIASAVVGILFFLKSMRNGWPWLIVVSFFFINGFINSLLIESDNIKPLTEIVGSMNLTLTFLVSLLGFLILLILAWQVNNRKSLKVADY